ncbi:MAG: 3-deoxy-8-phosphooctulonate synthase [Desulfobacterales bacterium]|nr:3-deoxy-8-phosphooctulonate synthase [Desulfobacterales bacterium]
MYKTIKMCGFEIGQNNPLTIISGPCVLENYESAFEIAEFLKKLSNKLKFNYIFKASYLKDNRTSVTSYTGPGVDEGLSILKKIKYELNIPVISDIHTVDEVDKAADVLDIIQIPAFLCRQTSLLKAASETGKIVNVKKGQFLSPLDMKNVVEKIKSYGNDNILLTERGSCFGYNNLVVDFRGIKIMQELGYPVVFDATHSVQIPGGQGGKSGGNREFAPVLAKAAIAVGVDAIFLEVHKDPDKALCDGPNSLKLENLEDILTSLIKIRKVS